MTRTPKFAISAAAILAIPLGCGPSPPTLPVAEETKNCEPLYASPQRLDFGRIAIGAVANSHVCFSSLEGFTLSTSSQELVLGRPCSSRVAVSLSSMRIGKLTEAISVHHSGEVVGQIPVEAEIYGGIRASPGRLSMEFGETVDFCILDQAGQEVNAAIASSDGLEVLPDSTLKYRRLRSSQDADGNRCSTLEFLSFEHGADSGVLPVRVGHSHHHATHRHTADSPVVISEFMADNRTVLLDADGDSSDWLELHNRSNHPVNLKGWSLTDDLQVHRKWVFPSTVLLPSARMVVFASGKDRSTPEFHTNFRLNKSGEGLALYTAKGELTQPVFDCVPGQYADYSFGFEESGLRVSQLAGPLFFPVPTPGYANWWGVFAPPPSPQLTCEETEEHQQRIALTATPVGATIRYTLDGSRPSEAVGFVYESPVECDASQPFQAVTIVQGCMPSRVATRKPRYEFKTSSPKKMARSARKWGKLDATYGLSLDVGKAIAPSSTVALHVDPYDFFGANGIYVNADRRGARFERSALYFPAGEGPSVGLCVDVRIHGGGSRYESPKKSFRLSFPTDGLGHHHHVLILRGGFNDSFCANQTRGDCDLLRDEFARRCHRDMGYVTPAGSFAELFLNQDYWGLYNLVERIDDAYLASELGIKKSAISVVSASGIQHGPARRWNDLLRLFKGDSVPPIDSLSALVDIDAFIDYVTLNWYLGNGDWPHANWYAYHQDEPDKKIQFLVWDAECTLESVYSNTVDDTTVRRSPIASMLTSLLDDARFRQRLQLRARALLAHGALSPDSSKTRYKALADEIRESMLREITRWAIGYQGRSRNLETVQLVYNDWLKTVDDRLSTYFVQRPQITLRQIEDLLEHYGSSPCRLGVPRGKGPISW